MTGTPTGNNIPTTGTSIDGILQGSSWVFSGTHTLTYSVYSETSTVWNTTYQNLAAQAYSAWSNVADIQFSFVAPDNTQQTSSADLTLDFIGNNSQGVLAFGNFPDPVFADAVLADDGETRATYPNPEGDISIYEQSQYLTGLATGGLFLATLIHEIGHTIGLKHPHDDGGNGRPLADPGLDNGYYTVMSYKDPQVIDYGQLKDITKGFQATPMPLDILAIQHIYGANMTFHAGDDTYNLANDGIVQTIWDAGGNDTLSAAALGNGVAMSLAEGSFTREGDGFSTVALAYNMTIENATGSAFADTITGNDVANMIDGGAGADSLIGGLGDDNYIVDNAGDKITENFGEGADTVNASVTFSLLTAGLNVENMLLTGTAAINGTGNTLDNLITGNSAANTLNGGAGADTMTGGLGNDSYIIDNAGDVVVENPGEGTDAIFASVSYSLASAASVENITLTGTAAINATGDGGVNILTGNSGSNTLDGGAGADTMNGGAGNDTYVVDNSNDVVVDSSGNDTLASSVNYTIANGSNIENLTITNAAAMTAVGNAGINIITVNDSGNDSTLDGGAGADTMAGGTGNDSYIIDNVGDKVIELTGEGTDSVTISSAYPSDVLVTFTLSDNIENMIVLGTSNVNLTGNTIDNTITGNAGVNTLDGGAGADTLIGGGGNDIYVLDNPGDVIIEAGGGGTDLVRSAATVSIAAFANVENVTLIGTAAVNATGNALVNVISGNNGDNTLDGGAGADTMNGGAGNDTFIVDNIGDVVNDAAGRNTVQSSISYTMKAGVYDLTLTGAADLNGTGNSTNNDMIGNTGNNTLDGGIGADTMEGGTGNDTYLVDVIGDIIVEAAASGTDTVISKANYTLSANIEVLMLTGTEALIGTGNALDNILNGSQFNNTLDGAGGADTMIGCMGNDVYVVDNIGDVVTETSNVVSQKDTVVSSIDYTLGANLENLTLSAGGHTGIGNALVNTLTGSSGNDNLDGAAGADRMVGGLGDDTYHVDNIRDTILEATGGGTDTVHSTVNWTLGAYQDHLVLEGTALLGTGNALANNITGNASANTLNGSGGNDFLDGGLGHDVLIGGTGADTFAFTTTDTPDTVNDFSLAQGDKLDISSILTGYVAGVSNITDFIQITTVGANSVVSVDTNGTVGGVSFVQVATLNHIINLTDEQNLLNTGHLIA